MNSGHVRATIRRMGRRARLWIWVGLAVALGVGLGWVPLFDVLGFELATAAALFAAALGLDLGGALARELAREPAGGPEGGPEGGVEHAAFAGRTMVTATLGAAGLAVGVMVIPAAIAAIRGLWQPTCDWRFGIEAYLAMPVVTAALAAASGHALGVVWGPRRFAGAALAQLPYVAVALAALWRFYSEPPVFSYNAVLGYFPGNLYDENIQLRWPLVWSRLEDLAWVAAVVALVAVRLDVPRHRIGWRIARPDGRRRAAAGIALGCLAGAIVLHLRAGSLGYAVDAEDIAALLGGRIETPHFVIHYAHTKEIDAEIAHAVASAFGDPLLGVATRHGVFINPGLIEGLAVAVDWPATYDRPTPHEAVRALQQLGMDPLIERLLSLQFVSVSSARGYTTAGSFLRFLLDAYGAAKLRAVYRSGGDFEAAYGVPLATLEAAWRKMLAAIELPPGSVEAQRERFRGGSVFARPCPHAVAARRERALRAYGAGDRAGAIALQRHICDDAPEEPRYRMDLADMLVGGDAAEHQEGAAIWSALATDAPDVTSTLRVEALERLARDAAARDDRAAVVARIQQAAAQPIDSNERRQVDAEAFALAHTGAAAMPLYAYFFLSTPVSNAWLARWATKVEPALGFAHYLLGLQLAGAGGDGAPWAEAAEELERALDLGLPGPPFVRNAARRLALVAYRGHDRARVAAAIAVLAGRDMTTPDHLLAADWQARLDFDAKSP